MLRGLPGFIFQISQLETGIKNRMIRTITMAFTVFIGLKLVFIIIFAPTVPLSIH
jgi:hypothetical protein